MSRPFDDFLALIDSLPGPDEAARGAAANELGRRTGQGRLGEIALWLAAWQGRAAPRVARPIIALYVAAHADAGEAEGAARVRLNELAAGGGAISTAARAFGAGVEAFDLAVDRPTPDAAERASMSERECAATLAFGMEALAKGPDLVILGDAAAGGERAAGALAFALFGGEASGWSGEPAWADRALVRARGAGAEAPLDLLREVGGRETAALAGAIVAARIQKVPVLLDGYAALAAGAVAASLRADALDHCLVADASACPGAARLAAKLGKTPLLDLGLSRSEGLAGVAALGVIRAAVALFGDS